MPKAPRKQQGFRAPGRTRECGTAPRWDYWRLSWRQLARRAHTGEQIGLDFVERTLCLFLRLRPAFDCRRCRRFQVLRLFDAMGRLT